MEYLVKDTDMAVVADAIRTKGGTSAPLTFPNGMAEAVEAISGGGGDKEGAYENLVKRTEGKPYKIVNNESITVASEALNGCFGVKTIELRASKSAGSSAFASNPHCTEYILPSLETTKFYTFRYNDNLSKIDLPKLTAINDRDFFSCQKLTAVILRRPEMTALTNRSAFLSTPIEKGTGYIYVPKTLVEQYKAATNWVQYAAQIRAIDDWPEITGG